MQLHIIDIAYFLFLFIVDISGESAAGKVSDSIDDDTSSVDGNG